MEAVESHVEEPGEEESGPANAENEVTNLLLEDHLTTRVVHQQPGALQVSQGRHGQTEGNGQLEGGSFYKVTPVRGRGREGSRDSA